LLLNASLTTSTDDDPPASEHAGFWRPVIEQIVLGILDAKASSLDPVDRSVVFAWWGAQAQALRREVEALSARFPEVRVAHLEHVNPAAMADAFCDGDPLGEINRALRSVGVGEVDWLPSEGWDALHEDAPRMEEFVEGTLQAHQQYVERLQGAAYERDSDLAPITGLLDAPAQPFERAVDALVVVLPNVGPAVDEARAFGLANRGPLLDADEVAAVHLYTAQTSLYRSLNAALRDPTRRQVPLFAPYLRLLLAALGKLAALPTTLYRGVPTDLRGRYPLGREIVWWGVSSCTANPDVARRFLGGRGKRTLFEITPRRAVPIRAYSRYQDQDEVVLPPGTVLRVDRVVNEPCGLSRIELTEVDGPRRVG
jgi:NAD:arginine ADP-ribosyltransferase